MLLSSLSLAVYLLLTSTSAQSVDKPCVCSALVPAGLYVNCSSLNLVELSHLPPDTTELHIQDNKLTSVSPGLFDRFVSLRKVSLSANPFHCDCGIQYLRNWLLKNRALVTAEPVCSSPSSVARKAITELTDDYFSSCTSTSCAYEAHNILVGAMVCCVIILLLCSLRLARKSAFILCIDEGHLGLKSKSLCSPKPKHKRRLPTGLSGVSADSDSFIFSEDLERPFNNMELLPQVLDVLHKKHNIKIKAT